jgi:predicted DCC family thiol-disulfide oxidoreductase YuxK
MMKHLVFYDGECGLCDKSVQMLLKIDSQQLFAFAPLQGETARRVLKNRRVLVEVDTLVLIEDYQSVHPSIYMYGHAVFRICWLLGGKWKLVGWLNFLPSFLYDWGYRLVARNRKYLPFDVCSLPDSEKKDRFLP